MGGGDRLVIVEPERQLGRGALRAEIAERLGLGAVRDLFPDVPEDLQVPRRRPPGGPSGLDLLEHAAPGAQGQGSNEWVVAARAQRDRRASARERPAPGGVDAVDLVRVPSVGAGIRGVGSEPALRTRRRDRPDAAPRVGATNVGGDTQDLYLERLDEEDRGAFRGRLGAADRAPRGDEVRGLAEPVVLEVRETRHGPILDSYVVGVAQPDVVEGGITETYALSWVGQAFAIAPSVLLRMAAATDFCVLPLGVARVGLAGPERRVRRRRRAHRLPVHGQASGPPSRRRATPVPGWTAEHDGTAGSTSTSSRGTWTHPRGTSRPRTTGSTTTTTRT